jgi:hypothetical protein
VILEVIDYKVCKEAELIQNSKNHTLDLDLAGRIDLTKDVSPRRLGKKKNTDRTN